MELIEGSETSANHNRTPGKYPKEYIQDSKHGESLKSKSCNDALNWVAGGAHWRPVSADGNVVHVFFFLEEEAATCT